MEPFCFFSFIYPFFSFFLVFRFPIKRTRDGEVKIGENMWGRLFVLPLYVPQTFYHNRRDFFLAFAISIFRNKGERKETG